MGMLVSVGWVPFKVVSVRSWIVTPFAADELVEKITDPEAGAV
jgi:hypothetical protein